MLGHFRPNIRQGGNTALPSAGRLRKVFLSTALPTEGQDQLHTPLGRNSRQEARTSLLDSLNHQKADSGSRNYNLAACRIENMLSES